MLMAKGIFAEDGIERLDLSERKGLYANFCRFGLELF